MIKTQQCSAQRLEKLLNHTLPERAETELIAHLDDCRDCQKKLDELMGGDPWSSEVRQTLASRTEDRANSGDASRGEFGTDLSGFLSVYRDGSSSFRASSSEDQPCDVHASTTKQMMAALKSVLGPSDDPRMLGRIGQYEVMGLLGRGATGLVVKAFQPALNRYVAIKILAADLAANPAARVRFSREAKAAAAVVNNHVVPIYAVDEYQGTPFLVMQYVTGGSLENRLSETGQMSPECALRIGLQIARGLEAAHAQGLIHRDIKPANILMEPGIERVLITDFGLARSGDDATLTHSGFIAGTPQYMSPEQARGEKIDQRTDLFSLGSVMYTMLAGRAPFQGETAWGVLHRMCEEPHVPLIETNPEVPRWLSRLVDRLLAKDPSRRVSSATEAANLLETCLAHLQNPSTCPLPRQLRDRPILRLMETTTRPIFRLGLLSALLGVASTLWFLRVPVSAETDEIQSAAITDPRPLDADSQLTSGSIHAGMEWNPEMVMVPMQAVPYMPLFETTIILVHPYLESMPSPQRLWDPLPMLMSDALQFWQLNNSQQLAPREQQGPPRDGQPAIRPMSFLMATPMNLSTWPRTHFRIVPSPRPMLPRQPRVI